MVNLTVRVEGPSSPFPEERMLAGVERLRSAGFAVDVAHAGPRGRHAYLNGTDDERLRSLAEALRSDVDVVWLARGGYGLTRLLDRLDRLDRLPARRPRVVGFSDATALLCHLDARGRDVHGPLITTLANESDASFAHLLDVLAGRATSIAGLSSHDGARVDVRGRVVAGNLCVLAHLVGTRSLPPLDGAILALEEIGERPYRIDRMLTQLLAARALDGVRAVIVGDLLQCDEPPSKSPSGTRDPAPAPFDVFVERLGERMPVVRGLPIGHGAPNFAIPFGADARLVVDDAGGRLELAGAP